MRRAVTTPFFPDQGFTMFDRLQAITNPLVVWTGGKTAVRSAILGGPAVEQRWSILSVSFQAYLRFAFEVANPAVVFGKFGKILAGFAMDQALSTQGGDTYLTTAAQLPYDTTLVVPLWDPASDPMPPTTASNVGGSVSPPIPSQCLALSAVLSPVVPLTLDPASQPAIGIWMLPSLLGIASGVQPDGFGLNLGIASFTINYDDGL